MQFIVTGYDGTDENAMERRLLARPAHIELGNKLREEGKHLYGVALLDEQDRMIGSVLITEFNSREELDEWLQTEPYVTGKVWEKIEVRTCKVGPSFAGLVAAK